MSSVEVDPMLIVKCRLCLDETGQYQIAPNIQMQMKYCFDIHVEPFDGLPQLICKKCQSVLSQYTGIKQFFQEKQKYLKLKWSSGHVLLGNNIEKQNNSISDVQANIESKSKLQKITKFKRKIKVLKGSAIKKPVKCKTTRNKDTNVTWKSILYSKYFVCRFCTERFKDVKRFNNHINKHCKLFMKYSKICKTFCLVKLNKIETKPNFTGSIDTVVCNKDKVIESKSALYYILYTHESKTNCNADKNLLVDDKKFKTSTDRVSNKKKKDKYSNVEKVNKITKYQRKQSSEIVSNMKKKIRDKKKRERPLTGKNLNKTILIDRRGKVSTNKKCIKVSDRANDKITQNVTTVKKCIDTNKSGSNSSIAKRDQKGSDNFALEKTNAIHDKTSNSIAGVSYIEKSNNISIVVKMEDLDSEIASTPEITNITHDKIGDSIAMISNKNADRFIFSEEQNCALDLKRNSKKLAYYNKNSNEEKLIQNDSQDKKNMPIKELKGSYLDNLHSNKKQKVKKSFSNNNVSSNALNTTGHTISNIVLPSYVDKSEIPVYDDLHSDNILNTDGIKTKLLNANPVANPKKLPKKNFNEPKLTVEFYSNEVSNTSAVIRQTVQIEDNDMLYIPCQAYKANKMTNVCNFKQQSILPRIQCKPTSDLMPLNKQNHSVITTTDWEMNNKTLNQNVMIQTNNVFYIPRDPYTNVVPVQQGLVNQSQRQNVNPCGNNVELNTHVQFSRNQQSFDL